MRGIFLFLTLFFIHTAVHGFGEFRDCFGDSIAFELVDKEKTSGEGEHMLLFNTALTQYRAQNFSSTHVKSFSQYARDYYNACLAYLVKNENFYLFHVMKNRVVIGVVIAEVIHDYDFNIREYAVTSFNQFDYLDDFCNAMQKQYNVRHIFCDTRTSIFKVDERRFEDMMGISFALVNKGELGNDEKNLFLDAFCLAYAHLKPSAIKPHLKDSDAVRAYLSHYYDGQFKILMANENTRLLHILKEDVMIGVAVVEFFEDEQRLHIHELALAPRYQGYGYGNLFFDFLKREFNPLKITVDSREQNRQALHFYTRQGFQKCKPHAAYVKAWGADFIGYVWYKPAEPTYEGDAG